MIKFLEIRYLQNPLVAKTIKHWWGETYLINIDNIKLNGFILLNEPNIMHIDGFDRYLDLQIDLWPLLEKYNIPFENYYDESGHNYFKINTQYITII